MAGFVAGEGCFYISIGESKTHKLGGRVMLRFQITQHSRDALLMGSLVNYLGCGSNYPRSNAVDFIVTKYSDIEGKILPFFSQYPLIGAKALDYADF